jgi:hypothetical protein
LRVFSPAWNETAGCDLPWVALPPVNAACLEVVAVWVSNIVQLHLRNTQQQFCADFPPVWRCLRANAGIFSPGSVMVNVRRVS